MPVSAARRRLKPFAISSVLVVLTLLLTGCSSGTSSSAPVIIESGTNTGGMNGDVLEPPVSLTAADQSDVFQTSTGTSTSLARLQRGHLMLVYFGYTHCPDVCPTTMAALATAIRELPAQEQTHIQVVFVTSDPARDTAPIMKAWLANFDESLPLPFIGLTARPAQIYTVAKTIGIPVSAPKKEPNGTVVVQHGAQTLAFVNGMAHVLWTAGTSPGQYAHDLRKIIQTVGGQG